MTPERKAQLDKNLQMMADAGASEDEIRQYAVDFKKKYDENQSTDSNTATGWLKDPTGNKTWEYQSRECKWYARKIGTTTQYNISDNTKYSTSVQKLDAAYPNEIKGCKKTVKDNKDTNTDVKNKPKVDTNIEKAEPKVDTNIEKAEPEDPTTV
jgi:hypothetical protein